MIYNILVSLLRYDEKKTCNHRQLLVSDDTCNYQIINSKIPYCLAVVQWYKVVVLLLYVIVLSQAYAMFHLIVP